MGAKTKQIAASSSLLVAAIWLTFASGCRRVDVQLDNKPSYPLRVVCTTGMVADMLKNIGGQHVAVQSLMGSGVDPHLYKPTPGDVRLLTSADVVFYSGLHLEGRLAELLEKLHRWKPAYAVSEGLKRSDSKVLRHMPGV